MPQEQCLEGHGPTDQKRASQSSNTCIGEEAGGEDEESKVRSSSLTRKVAQKQQPTAFSMHAIGSSHMVRITQVTLLKFL